MTTPMDQQQQQQPQQQQQASFDANDYLARALQKPSPYPTAVGDDGIPFYSALPQCFADDNPEDPVEYGKIMEHIPFLHYSTVMQNRFGGNTVYQNMFRGADQALRIQGATWDELPLRAPFGAKRATTKDGTPTGDPNRWDLVLTIEGDRLHNTLSVVDAKNLQMARARVATWFKKGLNPLAIDAFYKPLVTPAPPTPPGQPKKDFKDTFKGKVVLEGDGATQVLIFKSKRLAWNEETGMNELVIDVDPGSYLDVVKGCRVVPVFDLTGIWFMATQFGQGLQFTQLIVIPRKRRPNGRSAGAKLNISRPSVPQGLPAPPPDDDDDDADGNPHDQMANGAVPVGQAAAVPMDAEGAGCPMDEI